LNAFRLSFEIMKFKILAAAFSVALFTLPAWGQRVEKTARVRGRVTTLWGEPVEQSRVSFYKLQGLSGNSPTERLIRRVETDEEGNYKAVVPWGQYRVEVSDSSGVGRTEVWRFYLGENDNRVLDIGLPSGNWHFVSPMRVGGVVKQLDGTPVADATVTMIPAYPYYEPHAFVSSQGRTDAQGRYDFGSLEVGDFVVYVAKPGFLPASTAFRLDNGEKKTVNFELKIAPEFDYFPKAKK
jgi:hypothetical protein